jgi:hypothetical protein
MPFDNDEFELLETNEWQSNDREATQRVDLLTVLMHELGHVLGLPDLDAIDEVGDLMFHDLATGRRRMLSFSAVDAVFASIALPSGDSEGIDGNCCKPARTLARNSIIQNWRWRLYRSFQPTIQVVPQEIASARLARQKFLRIQGNPSDSFHQTGGG